MQIELKENEVLDDLKINGLKIIQNKKFFKFGIDAVLLSRYASSAVRKNSSLLDLGCGNAIIPLLLSAFTSCQNINGLELLESCATLAEKNVQLNCLENKIKIIKGDIKNVSSYFQKKSFDIITSNPPYAKCLPKENINNSEKQIARKEIFCNAEDLIKAVSYLLKDNGRFFLIHRPNRLQEILILLNKYKMAAKRLCFVTPFSNEKPSMFLLEAKKNCDSEILIEKNICIYEKPGLYSAQVKKIYEGII